MRLSLYLHLLHLTDKEKLVLHVFNSKCARFLTLLNICLLVLERAAAGLGSAFDIDREGDTEPALARFSRFSSELPRSASVYPRAPAVHLHVVPAAVLLTNLNSVLPAD